MKTPRILIIAGSDSGGGAGIQADIKTVTMLGGHAMTAVTAITAQNTLGVQAVHAVPTDMVVAQMRSCIDDIGVDAVKIGMIGSAETADAVADVLEELVITQHSSVRHPGLVPGSTVPQAQAPLAEGWTPEQARGEGEEWAAAVPIVFDPVMIATSGAILAAPATIAAFGRLMRLATVVTPNLPELEALGGEAAVRATGAALLIKGGHGDGDVIIDRLFDDKGREFWWEDDRIETTSTHGTGCTLASAIAEGLGRGLSLTEAIGRAQLFVRIALHEAPGFGGGHGHGPMGHQRVRLDCDLGGATPNQVTLPAIDHAASFAFYRTLGLTPIVESDGRYARFESAGGTTISIEAADEIDGRPIVFLECGDLDAAVSAVRAAGIAVADPVAQSWGWREARLADPAGNALCLYQAGENRRFPPWRLACPD